MYALASTVLDTQGGLMRLLEKHADRLTRLFEARTVVAASNSSPKLNEALNAVGFRVIERPGQGSFNGYCMALEDVYKTDATWILSIDFDRILHWCDVYPDELEDVIKRASQAHYAVLERSDRAYKSHHAALYHTEQFPNLLISRALGESEQHDYLAGNLATSRAAAEVLLQKGECEFYQLYGLWPRLLKEAGMAPTYIKCEGLEWETPDRFIEEVERVGGIAAWREQQSTPEEWVRRCHMAREFVKSFVK